MTAKNKYNKALGIITAQISGLNISWAIAGGMNHFIQGVKVIPSDIDIITTKKGIYKIEDVFKKNILINASYSSKSTLRSYYGKFKVDCTDVDVFANIENKIGSIWQEHIGWKDNIKSYQYNNIIIPVLSLEYELCIYEKLNFLERVEKIKESCENSFHGVRGRT